ncbi:hypothetical protein NHB34_08750 [Polynucleobacter sp. MWH-UH19D]|uniref:hypothetical protein n=1 Tax=Polynucleobacter sp. MWH-UH19D TaxID=1855610 RepID=UPI003364E1EF
MAVKFFLKGLSAEDRIFPQTIESSAKLAKGTLYEAWFDALQISPWYRESTVTGVFKSAAAEEVWEKFGDLRNLDFTSWWKTVGYKIFSESVPYQPLTIIEPTVKVQALASGKKPPVLKIEVPLNLHPKALREQFDEILKQHSDYYSESKDRWDHSTAEAHQYRESKLSYQTISRWLQVYREYEKQKDQKNFKLYNFAKEMELHPKLFKGLLKNVDVPEDLRVEAANVASDILKQVRNLMAHATELRFPCTDPHEWTTTQKRLKKPNL